MKTIKVKRLTEKGVLPVRAHPTDAGLDIFASADVPYRPGETLVVPTDIAVEIPEGYVGLVRDRSSVSKKRLKVTAGVVDAGYTGEVCVVLLNLSDNHGCIRRGERVAQLLVIPVALPEVEEVATLSDSERGNNGFGSTGA